MNKRIKKKHKRNTYQNQYKNGWDVIGIAIFLCGKEGSKYRRYAWKGYRGEDRTVYIRWRGILKSEGLRKKDCTNWIEHW